MSEFSVGKALLHVAFAVAFVIGLSIVFAVVTQSKDAYAIGEAAGKSLLWVVLAAFGASWAFQTDKGLIGIVLTGVLLLVVCFQLASFQRINKARAAAAEAAKGEVEFSVAPMTADEKRRPETIIANDRARLCQSALAFSVPQPTGFNPSPELETKLEAAVQKFADKNMGQWAFVNGDTGQILVIQAAKGVGGDEPTFRAFTGAVRKSVERTQGTQVQSENVDWTGGRGEYEMTADVNGKGVAMRCVSRSESDSLTVCVMTPTSGGDPLQSLRKGIRLSPCSA